MSHRRPAKNPPPAAPKAQQPELPLFATMGVTVTRLPGNVVQLAPAKIVIEGSVTYVAKKTGENRRTVLRKIEDGTYRARKMRPHLKNSKYKVDMTSVYEAEQQEGF